MRRINHIFALGPILALWWLAAGCDQGSKQSNQPAGGNPGATSSERGKTHPEQPTGKPQSGEFPSASPPPSGR